MEKKQNGNTYELMSMIADRTMELARQNSVLGEKIEENGLTIIPVSKLSVSFAGGGADMLDTQKSKHNLPSGGGAKVSLTPMSFLVIENGNARVISVAPPINTAGAQIAEMIINEIKNRLDKTVEIEEL